MIIKNMEEFGKAVDAVEDLQWCKNGEWKDYQFDYLNFGDLRKQLAEARIRIKPKTVTLYEYERPNKEISWGDISSHRHGTRTGRKIINGIVTEEEQV